MAVIELNELTYTYPNCASPALQRIDFQIETGQLVGVVGGNDSGKSTLCLALSGLIPSLFHGKMQGTVKVCNMDTREYTPGHFAGKMGLVLQNPAAQLSGMRYTVYEEIAFGLENIGTPRTEMPTRIKHALEQTGLTHLQERSPYTLSSGQQQRLAFASILALSPSVLILDEPTAMLDPQGRREVFDIIQNLAQTGTTIVIVEHHLEWIARYADRVIALEKGKMILDGAPKEVLNSEKIQQTGIGWLRYTQAASRGMSRGLWDVNRTLPVTVEDTVSGFQQAASRKLHHADSN